MSDRENTAQILPTDRSVWESVWLERSLHCSKRQGRGSSIPRPKDTTSKGRKEAFPRADEKKSSTSALRAREILCIGTLNDRDIFVCQLVHTCVMPNFDGGVTGGIGTRACKTQGESKEVDPW